MENVPEHSFKGFVVFEQVLGANFGQAVVRSGRVLKAARPKQKCKFATKKKTKNAEKNNNTVCSLSIDTNLSIRSSKICLLFIN